MKEAQDILPELRQEYEEVTRLLAQEQADIDEIENSDKDYLNELKATIAEQRYVPKSLLSHSTDLYLFLQHRD